MIEITDELRARVTSAEGIVDHVYLDSLGKATIGIGHLIQPHERDRFPEGKKISREEIDELFAYPHRTRYRGNGFSARNSRCPKFLQDVEKYESQEMERSR